MFSMQSRVSQFDQEQILDEVCESYVGDQQNTTRSLIVSILIIFHLFNCKHERLKLKTAGLEMSGAHAS